jgi:starch synthase
VTATAKQTPTLGLLPWGNVLEDFLDPSGLTIESFRDEFLGSWMFAWARALAVSRVRTELICVSRDARESRCMVHRPTGTPMLILPTTRVYRAIDRRMAYPYGRSARQVFARTTDARDLRGALLEVAREVAPYLATPPVPLVRGLRGGRWQALLCQEYEYPRFDVSVVLGSACGVPVFGCFQGGNYQCGRLERFARPAAIGRCAGLIVGPEGEAERVGSRYGVPPEKLARIPNPIDVSVWRPRDRRTARAELGIESDARVVAWHGRIAIDHKGLDVLLDAWGELNRSQMSDLRLVLIGAGQDSAQLDRIIAEKGLAGVMRLDRVVHDPVVLSRHLSAADVYVFPSRHEGFPVAPIEAMACGLPVVATDVAGVREILGIGQTAAGMVVPRLDPPALAAGLARLLEDDALRRSLGERARERAQGNFSLEVIGARLRELLFGATKPY